MEWILAFVIFGAPPFLRQFRYRRLATLLGLLISAGTLALSLWGLGWAWLEARFLDSSSRTHALAVDHAGTHTIVVSPLPEIESYRLLVTGEPGLDRKALIQNPGTLLPFRWKLRGIHPSGWQDDRWDAGALALARREDLVGTVAFDYEVKEEEIPRVKRLWLRVEPDSHTLHLRVHHGTGCVTPVCIVLLLWSIPWIVAQIRWLLKPPSPESCAL